MTTTVTSDHYPTQSCTERAWVVYCVFLVNFWAYLIEQPHTGASEIQRHVRSVLLRYKKLSTETSGRWRRHTNATSLESSLWSLGAPRCNLAEKNEKQSKNRRKVSEMKTNQIFINIRMIIVILINQGWSTALSALKRFMLTYYTSNVSFSLFFYATGWRAKSEKRPSKLGCKMPYRKCSESRHVRLGEGPLWFAWPSAKTYQISLNLSKIW